MSDYFDRVERQLVDRVQGSPEPSHRWSSVFGALPPIGAVVIVLAVVAVFISVGHRAGDGSSLGSSRSSIVFQASADSPHSSLGPAIDSSVVALRHRLRSVFPGLRVARSGQQIVVTGASEKMRSRVLQLAVPGRLRFYDWEANALTPNGKPVAGQLTAQEPDALTISQGSGRLPGLPRDGAVPLYKAVKLASKQPVVQPAQAHLSRLGASYYLFGAPGSAACATAAHSNGTTPIQGEHCLLAGPDTTPQSLKAGLPAGVTTSDGERLAVPQGTVVLQAASASASNQITASDPRAQFYVLRDAHRGVTASSPPQLLNQHFAIVLDTGLIAVPSIDFKTYPDGITGGGGADIAGVFTSHSAQDLAAILRSGPLAANVAPS